MDIKLRAENVRLAALAALPMAGAVAGAWFDERGHLGFTAWRAACRGAGLRLATLIDFTWQLLPLTLIGLLLGGLAVLAAGTLLRGRLAGACLAAHAGCALSLPVALVLCAFLPPALTLAADAVLATLAAMLARTLTRSASRATGAHP